MRAPLALASSHGDDPCKHQHRDGGQCRARSGGGESSRNIAIPAAHYPTYRRSRETSSVAVAVRRRARRPAANRESGKGGPSKPRGQVLTLDARTAQATARKTALARFERQPSQRDLLAVAGTEDAVKRGSSERSKTAAWTVTARRLLRRRTVGRPVPCPKAEPKVNLHQCMM